MEGEPSPRFNRRQMLRRMGIGTAVFWATPIVSTLPRAWAREPRECTWHCSGTLHQCGTGSLDICVCSQSTEGKNTCWDNSFCSDVQDCSSTSDCPPGYRCIPGTCCHTAKCLPPCPDQGRPSRRPSTTGQLTASGAKY